MPNPHPLKLRALVVRAAKKKGMTTAQIVELFGVSAASVRRWKALDRDKQDLTPRRRGGGNPTKFDAEGLEKLKELVTEHSDATLDELTDLYNADADEPVGRSTLGRALRKKLGFTRKKKRLRAAEGQTERVAGLRREFMAAMWDLDPELLIFVDEAAIDLAMTRSHARTPRGVEAIGTAPYRRAHLTMIGALTVEGLLTMMTVDGATDTDVFMAFLEHCLCPKLQDGDVVVMDNLAAHKTTCVREAIESCGARLVFQPPYSPHLNPIEECWSKVKAFLRGWEGRTRRAVEAGLAKAMDIVTDDDAWGWFTHAGYSGLGMSA